jgi:hypothetical protein
MRCLDYARHDGAGRTGRHSRKKRFWLLLSKATKEAQEIVKQFRAVLLPVFKERLIHMANP